MAKVDSTARFIERAREIHGDLYDYSETLWNGASKPITITCRACGPFTLSEAQSHYCKKACGCRCQGNRKYKTCECGFVGYGKDDFPPYLNGMCRKCHEENKAKTKNQLIDALVTYYREIRKPKVTKNFKTVWHKWASTSRSSSTFKKRIEGNKYCSEVSDWNRSVGLMLERIRKAETKWQIKARRWQAALRRRRHEHNC